MTEKLKILFEDNHLLVVDKPALLPTMGVAADQDSLVSLCKEYLKHKYNKPGKVYLGVVSRLDAFVSGVIVLARTSKSASRLTKQYRERTVTKTYLAIVPDIDSLPESGRLQDRLIKLESEHRMHALPANARTHPAEKSARLTFQTVGRHHDQRLLKIDLETGRKHQIRVQLAAAGCPVVGDRKYDSQRVFKTGIALHSHQVTIEHPTLKEDLTFQSEPASFWKIDNFGYDGGGGKS